MAITMKKERLTKVKKGKNTPLRKIVFYIYGLYKPCIVLNKFVQILHEKITCFSMYTNVLTLNAKNFKELKDKEVLVNHLWTQFKSLCIYNNKISKVAKRTCKCTDMTQCMLLECNCKCHTEHKFFFEKSWVLSDFDKALLSLEHLGVRNPLTQQFLKSPNISEICKAGLCMKCKTMHKTTICNKCNLHSVALSRTNV